MGELGTTVLYFLYPHSRTFFPCFYRDRKGERETLMRERSINCLPPIVTQIMDQAGKLGMCPDLESNPRSLGKTLQPTEPHWPGQGQMLEDTVHSQLYLRWLCGLDQTSHLNSLNFSFLSSKMGTKVATSCIRSEG